MGLVPLYDANGNVMLDSGGNIIYLSYEGPAADRTINIPAEDRSINIPFEDRSMNIGAE